ncbi:Kinesin-16 [Giardia muris]|uniref:Kinesin-like protein n=1 Tax=Giardia muris TaxID=5742 RepID=A0A4Z1SMN9_GIAMU|nr:Kinesin-16 [Giardia muris]|eukprot:TNJ26956.1 Kinesin-16 [Giardia muris]
MREEASNFRVCVRVRPLVEREIRAGETGVIRLFPEGTSLELVEPIISGMVDPAAYSHHLFSFDRVFGPTDGQEVVYEQQCRQAVLSVLEGFNATILAYGQTGTGKSFTISGTPGDVGIIPRAVDDIFAYVREHGPDNFSLRMSYLQIYNERLQDLLDTCTKNLKIREHQGQHGLSIYVDQLSEYQLKNSNEVARLLEYGGRNRKVGMTHMNIESSRSHTVFSLTVEQYLDDGATLVSKLNIVDLAGSERITTSRVTNERLLETKKINLSLTALANVISALIDAERGKRNHIPYRDSKLTKLLQDSLGGNCKTILVANVTPSAGSYQETLNTLKFADRSKQIRNTARVNERVDSKLLLKRYEQEIASLKKELNSLGSAPEPDDNLSPEERTRLYGEVEQKSREVVEERTAIRKLQSRMTLLEGYLNRGRETGTEGTSSNQKAGDWISKLNLIEAERRELLNEKQCVEQYRAMLVKQKEAIVALTSRLGELDEQLANTRDKIEEADEDQQELEAELSQLQRAVYAAAVAAGLNPKTVVDATGNVSNSFCDQHGLKITRYLHRQRVLGGGQTSASAFLDDLKANEEAEQSSADPGEAMDPVLSADPVDPTAELREILLEKQLEEAEGLRKLQRLKLELTRAQGELDLMMQDEEAEWGSPRPGGNQDMLRSRFVSLLGEASRERGLVTKIFENKLQPMLAYLATLLRAPDNQRSVHRQLTAFEALVAGMSEALANSSVAHASLGAVEHGDIAPDVAL